MKVLLLSMNDWAGLGSILTKSLRSVGVDARIYTSNKGKYKHPSLSIRKSEMLKFSEECDVIQFMHSEKPNVNINLKGKKVVVFHGGGRFRNKYKEVCSIFNPIVDASLIQTYDLFNLGAKNEIWLLPPFDTLSVKPVYETKGDKIIVGHYPSSTYGKGSDTINRMIKHIKELVPEFEYRYSPDHVSWKDQIKRMSEVDIYIERMSMNKIEKGGALMRTGVWGMTALEAASLGKIVVTNFYGRKYYKKEFGSYALQVANSEKDMTELLIKLLTTPKADLMPLKIASRKWVTENHSLKVVGERLRGIYERL